MGAADRHAFAFGTIERVFPGTTEIIDEVFEYSWQRDPWARGAYGIAASGQLYAWKEHLADLRAASILRASTPHSNTQHG